jgi:hypothetical protein
MFSGLFEDSLNCSDVFSVSLNCSDVFSVSLNCSDVFLIYTRVYHVYKKCITNKTRCI